jgi:hypothetical protein
MKNVFILLTVLLLYSCTEVKFGTIETLDMFNIYFYQDFEDNTIGNYLDEEWAEDWNYPQWADRVIPQEILSNQDADNGTKVLRWHFPEGGVGPREGGGQWLTDLGGNYNELYLSYKIKFNPGFQWVLGGKIHGLLGEPLNEANEPPEYDGGFNVLICWDDTPGQNIKFYYYHQDQTHDYGDIHLWNQAIETGRWYTVTLRVVMNTVSNGVGNNDGILEGYIDYKLVSQMANLRFRNYEYRGINMLEISTFFGGEGDEWAPQKDEWIETDDFCVFTYKDQVNVPRGNELSPVNRTLIIP